MKRLKLAVLTVAAWLRWAQVTHAVNTVRDRPLKTQPDWFIGWAMLMYEKDPNPGARVLYAAARSEWNHRRDLERHLPEVRAAADILIEPPKILFQRWRVECPSPDSRTHPLGFSVPDGSRMVEEVILEYGKRRRFIIDTPAGEKITVLDYRNVTAVIIGAGTTEGVLDETGEHLNIKG